jgi:hypothetical protein
MQPSKVIIKLAAKYGYELSATRKTTPNGVSTGRFMYRLQKENYVVTIKPIKGERWKIAEPKPLGRKGMQYFEGTKKETTEHLKFILRQREKSDLSKIHKPKSSKWKSNFLVMESIEKLKINNFRNEKQPVFSASN